MGFRIFLGLMALVIVCWGGYETFTGFIKRDVDSPLRYIFGIFGEAIFKQKRLTGSWAYVGGIFWFLLMLVGGLLLLYALFLE
jgi:hypothetical protein